MLFKRYTAFLITTSMLVQSVSPAFAIYEDVDKLEKNLTKLQKYSSMPAPLDFVGKPGKTAAGVLHWAKKNGKVYILLGKRDDSKDEVIGEWCNLGGKSDALDNDVEQQSDTAEGLTNTAEREVREESNGIYAHHPRLLRKQPFIALYSPDKKDGFLHYMYWQQVQYLEPEVFNDSILTATGHNKEYTDFLWVKASLLHKAVESDSPLLDVEGKKIEIFGPLFSSLSTKAGRTFLSELVEHQKIGRFNKHVRPLCNRLYIENNQHTDEILPGETIAVHWELPKSKPTPRTTVPFGENAFGKDYSIRQVIGPDSNVLSEDIIFSDKKKEEDVFAEAVAAHSAAMVELKRLQATSPTKFIKENPLSTSSSSKEDLIKTLGSIYSPNDFQKEKNPKKAADLANITAAIKQNLDLKEKNLLEDLESLQSNTPITMTLDSPQWNSNCEETLSRIHLRIILGKDYKTPEDFKMSNNPQREADLANIKAYFSIYNDAEYGQKGNEFKREIKLLDSDYDFFADILAWEEKNKHWPTFSHGASATINNLCKSFTYMRELTDVKSFKDLMALRGTDIYFKNDKTVWDMLNRTSDCEDTETSRAMLFLNFVLLAGLKTTNSTSSSGEYVLNDHSVQEQNIGERFEEALALAGFSKPNYAYFQSIFEQYIAHKHPTLGNSVLISISQNPKDLDQYTYPTRCGHFYKGENGQEIKSTLQVLNGIQNEFERQKKDGAEPFTLNSEKKKTLFPEARFFLYPDRVMDPTQTEIKAFDRFPLSKDERRAHDSEMRRTTIAIMADWLAQKTAVMAGSFINYPALKKIYKLAYEGSSGSPLEETIAIDGFLHLIRQGHLEGIKSFLDIYPEILHEDALKPKDIIKAAFESDKTEIIDFVLKDTLNTDINKVLDLQELMILLRTLRAEINPQKSYLDKAIEYIAEHYDFTIINENIKLSLIKRDNISWAPFFQLSPFFKAIIKKEPYLFPKAVDELFSTGKLSGDLIQKINDLGLITPQELLVKLCDHILNGDLKEQYQIHNPLTKLLELNADLKANHPQTDEPMAFLLLRLNFPFTTDLVCQLRNIPSLFDIKNKQGLNLIQSLQKNDLEGQLSSGLAMRFPDLCYSRSIYPPYQSYVGKTFGSHCPQDNPLRFNVNREWANKFQNAKTYRDALHHISTCPDSDILSLFEEKICNLNPYHLLDRKSPFTYSFSIVSRKKGGKEEENAKSNKKWLDEFAGALNKNDVEELLNHLKKMPPSDTHMSLYSEQAGLLEDAKKRLDPFKFKTYYSINSDLRSKEFKWVSDLKTLNEKTLEDVKSIHSHLQQVPNPAALRKGLEHLLHDSYAELFPEILKDLYVDEEEFLNEQKMVLETGSLSDMHPIYYALVMKNAPKVAQQMMKFLGEENLQKFLRNSSDEEFSKILQHAPEETLEYLFKTAPDLFIHQDTQRDFFLTSLTHLPMKLRKNVALFYCDKLKLYEKKNNSLPYFFVLLKDEKNVDIIKLLIDKDPTLLELQSEDHIGIMQMIQLLPNNKMAQILKHKVEYYKKSTHQ